MHLVSIVKSTNTKCKLIVDNFEYVIQRQIKTILNVSQGYNYNVSHGTWHKHAKVSQLVILVQIVRIGEK
jgi:hypothetical protein